MSDALRTILDHGAVLDEETATAAYPDPGAPLQAIRRNCPWSKRHHPETMSAAWTRRMAEETDGAAYADAVPEYAALGRDELREAARTVMAATSGRG